VTLNPPSRSVSLTSRLQNAPYLLVSCYTFCLNPRQSSRGLCRVQVVIYAPSSRTVPSAGDLSSRPGPSDGLQGHHISFTTRPLLVRLTGGLRTISSSATKALVAIPNTTHFFNQVVTFLEARSNDKQSLKRIILLYSSSSSSSY